MFSNVEVFIFDIFTDDVFTFEACVQSQRKHMYILTDTHVKCSCFLELREMPECASVMQTSYFVLSLPHQPLESAGGIEECLN